MARLMRVQEGELLGGHLLAELYNRQEISDLLAILNDGRQLYLHKAILRSWSALFRDMFAASPQMKEVGIADQAVLFEEVIKFMYTGQLVLTTENVTGIQSLAEKYRIDVLLSKCRIAQQEDTEKRKVRIDNFDDRDKDRNEKDKDKEKEKEKERPMSPRRAFDHVKRTISGKSLMLQRYTIDLATSATDKDKKNNSPQASPRRGERREERPRYTSPPRERPLSPRPRTRTGEPLSPRNVDERTFSPPRGRSPGRRSEAVAARPHDTTRRNIKSPTRGARSPDPTMRTSSPNLHSAAHASGAHSAPRARPNLANRRPPPKPPSADDKHGAADDRKRQIERLKAYWSEKSGQDGSEKSEPRKLNTSLANVDSDSDSSPSRPPRPLPASYTPSPLSIFSSQEAPAASLSRINNESPAKVLARTASAGPGMGRQIDPKLAKQIKKDSEKKEKDKKKEDKAKAEQAEKDRILLLQRVLAIETTHQNFVKEITKKERPQSPRGRASSGPQQRAASPPGQRPASPPARAASPPVQRPASPVVPLPAPPPPRAAEAPVASVSAPPQNVGPVSSSLPVMSSLESTDANDPFKRR